MKGKRTKSKSKEQTSVLTEVLEFFTGPTEAEDLRLRLAGKSLPCFLCKRELVICLSKKARPYLTCNDCLVQIFVRGDKGIERLAKLVFKDDQ